MSTSTSNTQRSAIIAAVAVICAVLLIGLAALTSTFGNEGQSGYGETLSSIPNTANPRYDALENSDFADREFIRAIFPVFAQWNSAAIKPYFAASTRLATTDNELNTVLAVLSTRLGHLQYFDEPQQISPPDASPNASNRTLTAYEFPATFTHGVARVTLVITNEGDHTFLYSIDMQVADDKAIGSFTSADT